MKTALGKGLNALLPERGDEVVRVEIERIIPNEYQPRKVFREEALRELAASIKEKGILQPVIVSRTGDGSFRLIAGERRWRAATMAGLKKIPVLIKEISSQDAIEIALIENIQREELNPVETADAFQRLLREFHMTQEDLSQRVGKDRATIANYLRILKLPDEIKTFINEGRLSMGHAKAIVSLDTRNKQMEVAREVMRKGLSVRETEALCKRLLSPATPQKKEKLPEVEALEDRLTRTLGTKVQIRHKDQKGRIEIEYYSLDELDRLLEILEREA
ncbi:MAG: ParB/RepB/Spo0J family partition protein [Nitrospirales bacterium]|nr:ParB/RepB/Spo0J family partition protein [Nitrospirales bacterium]